MSNELIKKPETGITRPTFIKEDDHRGTEHIEQADIKMPRLALAQKMSAQLDTVEGLKFGDMFNSLTEHNYGRGPIDFMVIRADKPRGIEFNPISEGGGVKDLNVPRNDPRMKFGPNGEKPIATLFYDYIIALIPSRELIALSLKITGLTAAKTLNGLMSIRGGACFAGLYELTITEKENSKGKYAIYNIRNSPRHEGWAPDVETYEWAEGLYNNLRTKEVKVDYEDSKVVDGTVTDDVPF